MSRPGVEVSSAAAAPPVGVPTDTSVAFILAEAQMGPLDQPTRITSLDQFTAVYGQRIAGTYGYDALDVAFHEGLTAAYFMRIADGAAIATVSAASIVTDTVDVMAASAGAWGNSLVLATVAGTGGTFIATVRLSGKAVQTSQPLSTSQDLADFLAQGAYLRLEPPTDPTTTLKAGTATLAGGDDGTVPAAAATVIPNALALIPKQLGPGQVLAPGRTSAGDQAALLGHAAAVNKRVALLDGGLGASAASLKSQAAALRGLLEDRYGSLWAPWAVVPGLAPGTTRRVPWSALQAGLCARNDLAGNPNQAAAGSWGVSSYAIDLATTYTTEEMEDLLYAGVNTARSIYGGIEAYAFRTLADPAGPRAAWREFNHARLNMAIVAQSEAIGEDYVFGQLDGRGHLIAAFAGDLAGMLIGYYNGDALFGDDPTDAFVVNVGPAVNTPEKLADGILSAVLSVRMSPHAELVQIQIVKVPVTTALAA